MKLQAGPDERGLRLDVFLSRRLNTLTRSHIQTLNRSGSILIAGRREKAGYRIRGDEAIDVDIQSVPSSLLQPKHIPFQIYYEDKDLAVIEKAAGVVVHPGAGTGDDTLVHGLLFHFKTLSAAGGESRPGIVHRLDKWTSGLLVVAKNDQTHARLSRAFQDRKVEKTYKALVHGKLPQRAGEVDMNIGRHTTIRTRMAAQRSLGRPARTRWQVIEEFGTFSLLEVKIETGRTHQIRVHLSSIGHPVVGDNVYGADRYATFAKYTPFVGVIRFHDLFI